MKKNIILSALTIGLCLGFTACGGDKKVEESAKKEKPKDIVISGLKGKVSFLRTNETTIGSNDTIFYSENYDTEGNRTMVAQGNNEQAINIASQFKDGKLVSVKMYEIIGKDGNRNIVKGDTLIYNADNLLDQQISTVYTTNADNEVEIHDVLISSFHYTDGKLDTIMNVNKNGDYCKIKNEFLDENESKKNTVVDASGIFAPTFGKYKSIYYDSMSRIVKTEDGDSNYEYEFDENSNIIKLTIKTGNLTMQRFYEYSDFDKEGNWTTCKRYNLNADGSKEIYANATRVIEYYK